MSESMLYELSQKLDQRGYEGQMALGYLDAINDLMKIEDRRYKNQPQLNENQKLLLEDLKTIKESHEDKNILGLIWVLGQRFTTVSNIKTFTNQEILQVLQTLEQEEE